MDASNQPITTEELLAEMAWLRGLARRMANEVEVAEDAVQETFLAALRRGPSQRGNLRAWLSSVLRNAVRRRVRSERRHDTRVETWANDERDRHAAPLDVTQRFALEHDLSRAVKALDPELRRIVLLRFLEGNTLREVAEREGLPLSTVDARITRALGILRAKLERSYGTRADGRSRFAGLLGLYLRHLDGADVPTSTPAPVSLSSWTLAKWAVLGSVAFVLYLANPLAVPKRPEALVNMLEHEHDSLANSVGGLAEARRPAVANPNSRAPLPAATLATGSLELSFTNSDGIAVPTLPVTLWPRESATPLPAPRATDANGRLTFVGLRPGWYTVTTDRLMPRHVEVASNERQRAHFDVPGEPLTGIVVDGAGSPVPDAKVWVLASPGGAYSRGAWVRGVIEVDSLIRTDESGCFVVPSCGDVRWIGACAPGHAPALPRHLTQSAEPRRALRLVLREPGGALTGTIVDAQAVPVPGAIVFVDGHSEVSPTWPLFSTRANGSGDFRIEGMATGTHSIVVHAPGFAPWRGAFEVLGSQPTQRTVQLDRGARLQGVVRDSRGVPVPDAVVTCQSLDRHSEPACLPAVETRTDAGGRYALEGLDSGPQRVVAVARGIGRWRSEETLNPLEDRRLDLRLESGRMIEGVVVDEGGEPLPGLSVVCHVRVPYETERAITDERGHFRFAMYARGPLPLVVVEHGWRVVEQTLDEQTEALRLVVRDEERPSAVVRGRVDAADGRLLFRITKEPSHRGWRSRPRSDGTFESGLLPPGEYHAAWLGPDCKQALTTASFRLLPGAVLDLGELEVQEAGSVLLHLQDLEALDLRGMIHDFEGRLVRELQWDAGTLQAPERIALAAGEYQLELWSARRVPGKWTLHVRAGRVDELRPILQTGSPVSIEVEDPSETNFDTLELSIAKETGDSVLDVPVQPVLYEPGGGYRLELALPAGTYRLTGSRNDRRVLSSSFRVDEDSETRLRLRLE